MNEKILIALSDKSLADALSKKCTQMGYFCEVVENGNDALARLKSFNPDAFLVDITLPGISGYEVLTQKSFDRDVTKIPTIIVSNSGMPIDMRKIPSNPTIRDFVIKAHVDPEEVVQKLEKIFGRTVSSAGPTSQIPASNGKKILWVEDDKLLSTILSKKIENSGFMLLKAKNGDEAFTLLNSEMPDIIVLDIILPGMGGLDILQKIKMDPKLKNLPVIMLSNISKQGDIEKAKLLGANRFIVKAAVSLDEIINEIRVLIKK